MKIIKRSGQEVDFDREKIVNAIKKANNEEPLEFERLSEAQIQKITNTIEKLAQKATHTLGVEEIQDSVEELIMSEGAFKVARLYITYRFKRSLVRKANLTDAKILSLINCDNEEIKQENSNKNPVVVSVQRDYMAGVVSNDITERLLLPEDIVSAHKDGIIHFHDSDYFAQNIYNCSLVNLEDMLNNGTVISQVGIDKPKSFQTACTLTSQIVAQVASSQYGGQTISLSHIAPFVDISRKKFIKQYKAEFEKLGIKMPKAKFDEFIEEQVRKEVENGCQTIQYQLITLQTTNGQAPFVSVYMYLGEIKQSQTKDDLALIMQTMLNQRIKGVKNEQGVFTTPAFPKLLYVLEPDNIDENSKYWYLTQLAAKCTAKRMAPDYISEKLMKELKNAVYPCMGCRSFLTPDRTKKNYAKAKNYKLGSKYYGRFNQGVVTLNLVDVALSSQKDENKFWQILDERLDLCYRALMCRHKRLLGTKAKVAPILWQHGAIARLNPDENIDELLKHGYSTISLGFAGLAECVYYMKDISHTSKKGEKFGLEIMQRLNDAAAKYKAKEDIDFSVYGTPLESTTYKFAKCLQRRFGIIKGVSDKNYITNSYHIHVTEKIDAFSKLQKESRFQKLSPGGAISYVEVPDLQDNIPAVLSLIKYIYETIMYAELNTKSDYCFVCGFDGEIEVIKDKKSQKLQWQCPNCLNIDQNKMSVARRTCGYIGTQFWNQGRTQEIKERVLHL